MPASIVIGASQGIGLAVAQRFASRGDKTYATVRTPKELLGLHVLKLDILDQASIDAAAAQVDQLDTLYVNAAIGEPEDLLKTTPERLREYFENNVIGQHRVFQAFLPALRKGTKKTIVLTTSGLGSLGLVNGAKKGALPEGGYPISKTALNAYAVQLQTALAAEGFKVIVIHPGVVRTTLGQSMLHFFEGGPVPIIDTDESAEGIVKTLDKADAEFDGKVHFWTWAGTEMAW